MSYKIREDVFQTLTNHSESCITARVLCDSVNPDRVRLTTMEWVYPRFIHCYHKQTEFLSQIGDEMPKFRKFNAVVKLEAKVAQFDWGNFDPGWLQLRKMYPNECVRIRG